MPEAMLQHLPDQRKQRVGLVCTVLRDELQETSYTLPVFEEGPDDERGGASTSNDRESQGPGHRKVFLAGAW